MTPFARLALAHAVGVCGDLFVTVALADSLFFAVKPDEARVRVLGYLLLTMAPFVVIAPVMGPMLDRSKGGRRLVLAGAHAGRAVLCTLMAVHLNDLLLYPLAFGALVLSKTQNIAKSSLVPGVVGSEDELVLANSRLALLGVLGGAVGAAPAAGMLKLVGGTWVLRTGAAVFALGVPCALAVPRARRVEVHPTRKELTAELHQRTVLAASTAMGVLRGVVGFMTFFAAFVLKSESAAAWVLGLVIAVSAVGNGAGTLMAPQLRRHLREEWILVGSVALPGLALVFAARAFGTPALTVSAALIAAGAACGRLAFDSLVQRDAPDAARGRAFARFETRFQLTWVVGAVIAVLIPTNGRLGLFIVAVALLFAGLSYLGFVRRPQT